jgi:CRP/FNR family transcriptional regulator
MTQPLRGQVAAHDHRDHCVALVPIFAKLAPDERHEIAQRARQKKYGRNEQLYGAGEKNPYLMIVHRGRVKIYRLAESGHEQLIRVLGPGDFIGEMSFISASETDHFAATLEDSQICSLHHEDIRGFLLRYPTIAFKMLETVTGRLEQTERLVSSLTGEDAERRIASFLLELAARDDRDTVELPVSKKDLASYLGTTPETVSRRLTAFEERGWIRQGAKGRIEILDREAIAGV